MIHIIQAAIYLGFGTALASGFNVPPAVLVPVQVLLLIVITVALVRLVPPIILKAADNKDAVIKVWPSLVTRGGWTIALVKKEDGEMYEFLTTRPPFADLLFLATTTFIGLVMIGTGIKRIVHDIRAKRDGVYEIVRDIRAKREGG